MSDNITMLDAICDLRARVGELEKERQGGDVEWINAEISECTETFQEAMVSWNRVPLLRARWQPMTKPPAPDFLNTGLLAWQNHEYLLVTFGQEMVIVRSKDIFDLKPVVDSAVRDERVWYRILITNRPYLLMGRTRKNELVFRRWRWGRPIRKTMKLLIDGMEPVKT